MLPNLCTICNFWGVWQSCFLSHEIFCSYSFHMYNYFLLRNSLYCLLFCVCWNILWSKLFVFLTIFFQNIQNSRATWRIFSPHTLSSRQLFILCNNIYWDIFSDLVSEKKRCVLKYELFGPTQFVLKITPTIY